MTNKILDACAFVAVFAFCFCCSHLGSCSPFNLLGFAGAVLACCELVAIINFEELQW